MERTAGTGSGGRLSRSGGMVGEGHLGTRSPIVSVAATSSAPTYSGMSARTPGPNHDQLERSVRSDWGATKRTEAKATVQVEGEDGDENGDDRTGQRKGLISSWYVLASRQMEEDSQREAKMRHQRTRSDPRRGLTSRHGRGGEGGGRSGSKSQKNARHDRNGDICDPHRSQDQPLRRATSDGAHRGSARGVAGALVPLHPSGPQLSLHWASALEQGVPLRSRTAKSVQVQDEKEEL